MLHIAAVERETGIAKDTLRVWEKRYGFPQPLRDTTGDRVYAASQVARLRQIRQLLDAGMRPGKVVGLGAEALARLLAETSVNDLSDLSRTKNAVAPPAQSVSDFLDLIAGHSPQALRHALAHAQLRMGVAPFVTELLAPLNQAVGEAWVQGRFKVFEEHFYTEVIGSLLRETIASLAPLASARRPKVLLTTLPPEQHGLGLLMVEALLTLEGCCCVSLGTQTPLEDLAHAAHAHHVDLIALSFSSVHPESLVLDNLQALRNQLPQPLGLWVGGACPALYRHPIAGVVPVGLLTNIPGAVARWRRRETETHNTRTTRT
ncbi:MerR family transcriptional regulator [Comamonas terrigena]|nr:MerR family transcriptional regulator [Comamonas terrigena]MDH1502893.1 MerR family transcriptional regulator [Comamonas terrigena]